MVTRFSGVVASLVRFSTSNADAERAGKCAEMFESRGGVFHGAEGPRFVFFAEVHDELFEGNALGSFEGAFDLVHGVDAARFLRVHDVDSGCAGAAHLPVGEERRVHGVRFEGIGCEPGCQFHDVLAAGVVKVLARSKELDAAGAGAHSRFKQAGMQPLLQKDMCGKNWQHASTAPAPVLGPARLLLSHSLNNLPQGTADADGRIQKILMTVATPRAARSTGHVRRFCLCYPHCYPLGHLPKEPQF